jgi:basic amino acid/polyamine antiporter, APA family
LSEAGVGPQLERRIGLVGSSFLSFNGMVGAGIFALPAALHIQFGAFSPWLFPIFGLLFLLIAMPIAKLAGLFSGSGGPVAYTACFGPAVSFQVGWLYYIARVTAYAANANVFATYAASLWPSLGSTAGRAAVIVSLVGLVGWINLIGVKRAIRALDLLSLLKALPLIGLAIWALSISGTPPAPDSTPPLGEFGAAALITLYAFIGFENSVVPAGETKRPEHIIPRALIATVVATAMLYFLIQLAYVSVMPAGAEPDAPLAALGEVIFGPVGMVIISLTAMASVAGNFLGSMTSTPRVTYALAEDRLLPSWFARINPQWHTPSNSIIFMAIVGGTLALTGSFVWLAVVSTLSRMFVYAASIAALPAARKAARKTVGPALYLLMAGGISVCIWAAAQSEARSWLMLAAVMAVGTLLYAVAIHSRRKIFRA